ncbi:pre-rRNA processing protein [Sorochytrium milnesiophthora]
MFLTRSEYDRGVNTFSPEGRLFQVEYALEAIKLGSTAIGVRSPEGVVLAVEKRVTSPLLEPKSIEKVYEIDRHIGTAVSGLTADARTIIEHARVEAQNHRFTYNEAIKVESVTQAVCDLALRFGEGAEGQEASMSRPFGVALLLGGVDEFGPQLYYADPSGTFVKWDAKAIAETLALKILKQVMEEKLSAINVEVASVTPTKGYRLYSEDEVMTITDSTVAPQAFSDLSLSESLRRLKLQGNSKNGTQQKIANLLQALDQILTEKGVRSESPTALLGALLTLIDQQKELSDSADDLVAAAYLLALVLPRAPAMLIRSRSSDMLRILGHLLSTHIEDASTTKSIVNCLETVLLHLDAAAWAQSANKLLYRDLFLLVTDQRPKVRHRAHYAIQKILASPPPPTTTHPAARATGEMCTQMLAEFVDNDAESLVYLLSFLQLVVEHLSATTLEMLCDQMFALPQHNNAQVTSAVFQVFGAILSTKGDTWGVKKVEAIIDALQDLKPHLNDAVLAASWLQCYGKGILELAKSSSDLCGRKLPAVVGEHLFPFLQSTQASVVQAAGDLVIQLIRKCVQDSQIDYAVTLAATPLQDRTERADVEKLIITAEMGLSVRYREAWPQVLLVIKALFERLGERGAVLMRSGVEVLSEFRNHDDFPYKVELDDVLGAAVTSLGPEQFLEILPLNLEHAGDTTIEIRTYLLPLLAKHVRYTRLAYFVSHFFPVIDYLKRKQDEYLSRDREVEAKLFEVLVSQVWALLPGFCTYPLDLKETFKAVGPRMGDTLRDEPELRPIIATSLHLLISKNLELTKMPESDLPAELVSRGYSLDVARSNVRGVAVSAKFFLPLLFNIYKEMEPEKRGYIGNLVAEFVSIADVEVLSTLYNQLLASLRQPNLPPVIQHALFDLALHLVQRLPSSAVSPLYTVVMTALAATFTPAQSEEPDVTQQKKCYKVLTRMCEIESAKQVLRKSLPDLVDRVVRSGMLHTGGGARRSRLQFLVFFFEHILDTDQAMCAETVRVVLPEAIEATKEVNEKSRSRAFDLLVIMGQVMLRAHDKNGHSGANSDDGDDALTGDVRMDSTSTGAEVFVKMVAAGLAAATPHFVSATMIALARLMFEYKDMLSSATLRALMDNVCLFAASDSREIARSVFPLFKVALAVLPAQDLQVAVPQIVSTALALSDRHGNTFKVNVRHLLQRLAREVGLDAVDAATSETHKKLISNLRKRRERAQKRREQGRATQSTEHQPDASAAAAPTQKKAGGVSFGGAFEDVVYASESDDAGDDADSEFEDHDTRKAQTRRRRKGDTTNAWIKEDVEDDGDALDFLDRKVISKVLASDPSKASKRQRKQRPSEAFQVSEDGRLVFEDSEEEKSKKPAPKVAKSEGDNNYYLEHLNSADGFTGGAGTKVKFGNASTKKRARDTDDDGEEERQASGDDDADNASSNKKGKLARRDAERIGQEYRAKRAGGDVKRAGKPDPFAYIPLTAKIVGNRKKSVQMTGTQRIASRGGPRKGNKKHKK